MTDMLPVAATLATNAMRPGVLASGYTSALRANASGFLAPVFPSTRPLSGSTPMDMKTSPLALLNDPTLLKTDGRAHV